MIEKYCDRAIWMEQGKIKKEGNVKNIVRGYEVLSE
jgi:ABC-type polysaccharide/polyol phosphate transport system ATPase subunit